MRKEEAKRWHIAGENCGFDFFPDSIYIPIKTVRLCKNDVTSCAPWS